MWFGSFMIIAGTIICIAVGPSGVAKFEIECLVDFWKTPVWIIYLIVIGGVAFVMLSINKAHKLALESGHPRPGYRLVLPITFAVSSALAGSMCVVQAKTMSELFEIFVSSPVNYLPDDPRLGAVRILTSPFFYITLGACARTAFMHLSR